MNKLVISGTGKTAKELKLARDMNACEGLSKIGSPKAVNILKNMQESVAGVFAFQSARL